MASFNISAHKETTNDRLMRSLSLLKPNPPPGRWRKMNFPDPDNNIQLHLNRLGAPQLLSEYLAWIPFDRFTDVGMLVRGGFSVVWKGTVKPLDSRGWASYVPKQLPSWKRWWNNIAVEKRRFPLPEEVGYEPNYAYNHVPRTYALKEIEDFMLPELLYEQLTLQIHIASSGAMPQVIGLSQTNSGKYVMVMTYAVEGNLENTKLEIRSWDVVYQYAYWLAKSLCTIHKAGFTHGDLHPGNIVFYDECFAAIIDVGLGKCFEDANGKSFYGRIEYLPPEIFEEAPYTAASDIYSLGTLLWQMVTRVPPQSTAEKAINTRSDRLREEMIPGAPRIFEDIVRSCWNPDPAQRPEAQELVDRLYKKFNLKMPFSDVTNAFIAKRQAAHQQQQQSNSFNFTPSSLSRFHTLEELRGQINASTGNGEIPN
ncbi:kinase-like domain-containing protein [Endogone sp. FLAS-F59071]|nr:kinase-like domain-containing protein [Endogone sp. FLAS-F59071]|eukprot:RUS22599.1 kinase-like domain-containing protein [Endogone sp. FLAS-F59071]